jgi:hypothetical protein
MDLMVLGNETHGALSFAASPKLLKVQVGNKSRILRLKGESLRSFFTNYC